MSDSRYDLPDIDLDAVGDSRVPLWNPGAAANWSLLFTPAFGSYLHTRNWTALGRADEARHQRTWFAVSVALIVVTAVLSVMNVPSLLLNLGNFVYLLIWYFKAAKPQIALVKATYGKDYRHLKWWSPLGIAAAIWIGLVLVTAIGSNVLAGMAMRGTAV